MNGELIDFITWWYHVSDYEVPSRIFASVPYEKYLAIKEKVKQKYIEWCGQVGQQPVFN